MSAYTHSGKVYFAVVGEYVKIGYTSSHIANRIHSLAREVARGGRLICPDDIDCGAPVQLIGTIPGCVMRDEKRLHSLFAAHHVIGEWFRYDGPFMDQYATFCYITYKESLADFRHARAELKRRPSLAVAA